MAARGLPASPAHTGTCCFLPLLKRSINHGERQGGLPCSPEKANMQNTTEIPRNGGGVDDRYRVQSITASSDPGADMSVPPAMYQVERDDGLAGIRTDAIDSGAWLELVSGITTTTTTTITTTTATTRVITSGPAYLQPVTSSLAPSSRAAEANGTSLAEHGASPVPIGRD